MGFRNNQWCSLFSVEPKGPTWTKGKISISRRNQAGEYETSFSGFVDFMGTACASKAAGLRPTTDHPIRIRLREVDIDNKYDKERGVMYWNPKVWSFDTGDETASDNAGTSQTPVATGHEDFMQIPEGAEDEGLPW